MAKKKQATFTPAEMRDVRLVKQVPFYPHRAFDPIFIRNMDIRIRWETMGNFNTPYEYKMKYLTQLHFTSEENIKRIVSDNVDK